MLTSANYAQAPEDVPNYILANQTAVIANTGLLSPLESYLWERAKENNLSYETLWQIINCESGWQTEASGDHSLAFGLLQYHESTFNAYKQLYQREDLDYHNPYNQIFLATKMIADGYGSEWTCFKKTYADKI